MMLPPQTFKRTIGRIVREEWGRILASLVKTLGNLSLAEDCLQDAVVSAMDHWGRNGLPRSPTAWLITVARRKAIDRLRRDQTFAAKEAELSYLMDLDNLHAEMEDDQPIPDKRLEMIFACCHPDIEEKSRVALTLRTLGGLTTQEIAAAFLDKHDAMQQRLTRAKRKIAADGISYEIPDSSELAERLGSVLRVIYLIFNEGYSANSGDVLIRKELSDEAIRLARIVSHLLPEETEVQGLLALMLLHDSRRIARQSSDGAFIPLEHQNRNRWNRAKIDEGVRILTEVLPKQRVGAYQLQAAISGVHAQSPTWADTNWAEIVALYEVLHLVQPSDVVRLNQAVAVSFAESPAAGLKALGRIESNLAHYQSFHAAQADMLLRDGQMGQAAASFRKAIAMAETDTEREFLSARLALTTQQTARLN